MYVICDEQIYQFSCAQKIYKIFLQKVTMEKGTFYKMN